MTNKELQAFLTRFPDDAVVSVRSGAAFSRDVKMPVYKQLTEAEIKLRRMLADSHTHTFYMYSEKGRDVILVIGD